MEDRKPPRRVLEMAETILRALDRAGIGMTVAAETPDGAERIYANRAAADILGVPYDETEGVDPMSALAPGERERLEELREALRRDASIPPRLRTRIVRPSGDEVPVELGLAADVFEGTPTVIGFLRDLSGEERMADALRRSESNFRILAEAAPDSIAVLRRGVVLYLNPAGARMLGYDRAADVIGTSMAEFLSPEDVRTMNERVARTRDGERLAPYEYEARRKDGSTTSVEISSIFIDYEGAPAVLGIGREVTERKLLQAELMQADRMATVGTLAAGVAHEINNPLTYVLLHLERLARMLPGLIADPDRRDGTERMIAEALEGGERMRSIVRDLLAFSRPDDRERRRVDVRQILDSTVKLAGTGLKHRAMMITEYGDVGPITSNPSKLGQVFLNVLVNALQAVEGAGTEGEVHVRLRAEDEDVVVEISDNGPGIPTAELPRIFDPFFTTKPVGTGTGLGLPISRSIIEALGGSIAVRNREPSGVRVAIRLPAGDEASRAPSGRHRLPSRQPRASAGRVLVVDDEAFVARALAALLEDHYDTTVCTDGEQALTLLCNGPAFDAVFCDVSMPAPDGIDIYRRACERRPEYQGRFAFVTGGATTERTAAALAEVGAPILSKPFDIRDVIALAAELTAG